MVHWQPPPPGTHNGQITGYKIRYRKVSRKSDVTESIGGTQIFQLIEGGLFYIIQNLKEAAFIYKNVFLRIWRGADYFLGREGCG